MVHEEGDKPASQCKIARGLWMGFRTGGGGPEGGGGNPLPSCGPRRFYYMLGHPAPDAPPFRKPWQSGISSKGPQDRALVATFHRRTATPGGAELSKGALEGRGGASGGVGAPRGRSGVLGHPSHTHVPTIHFPFVCGPAVRLEVGLVPCIAPVPPPPIVTAMRSGFELSSIALTLCQTPSVQPATLLTLRRPVLLRTLP